MKDLELAIQAKDPVARQRILREARRQGMRNVSMLISQAKANVKRRQTQDIFDIFLGE